MRMIEREFRENLCWLCRPGERAWPLLWEKHKLSPTYLEKTRLKPVMEGK